MTAWWFSTGVSQGANNSAAPSCHSEQFVQSALSYNRYPRPDRSSPRGEGNPGSHSQGPIALGSLPALRFQSGREGRQQTELVLGALGGHY